MPDFKSCIKFHAGKESTESPFEQTIFLDFSGKAKLEKKKIKKFPFLPKEIFSGIFFLIIIIYYYLSPQTRQPIQRTLYGRLLVYINFDY